MDELTGAFPYQLAEIAQKPISLLRTRLKTADRPLENIILNGETLSIPDRIYDGLYKIGGNDASSVQPYIDPSQTEALTTDQQTIFFCLLTRHHNGFVREAALCRLPPQATFIAPFVAQLASEYVFEILMHIGARLDDYNADTFGAYFRENPLLLARLRQRMVSYWDCYYRWKNYHSRDGQILNLWQSPYIGFEIFDRFAKM